MGHDNPEIRVIAVWVLINLLWTEDKSASKYLTHWIILAVRFNLLNPLFYQGSQVRVQKLREIGFEDKVKNMTNDENLDVRERVKTVLNQFSQV